MSMFHDVILFGGERGNLRWRFFRKLEAWCYGGWPELCLALWFRSEYISLMSITFSYVLFLDISDFLVRILSPKRTVTLCNAPP
jgi:hypothetical protein